MLTPTQEQQQAIDLFAGRGSLRIDAYAGAGKTSTLLLLAQSTARRGYYLAFNRAAKDAAVLKFPPKVQCKTTHGLAFNPIKSRYGYSDDKMRGTANANLIAEALSLPEDTPVSGTVFLSKRSYAAALRNAMARFLYSENDAPGAKHFWRVGKLASIDRAEFLKFTSEASRDLLRLWEEMQYEDSRIPLGYDGYLKLWALGRPRISADYILLDEAQDSNPVVLKVLREQSCQMVYVGDPYQQIYEWRGAVNAMEQVETDRRTALTQSFRFGDVIASGATKVISKLGATKSLRGTSSLLSHIGPVHPIAILCRSNAGVIASLITHQNEGARTYVVGGTIDQQRLLENVKRLKRNIPSELPEFFGFVNWDEVVDHVEQGHDESLRLLVNLVKKYGEDRLLVALRSCVSEERNAQIIVSTAHKAKGCEWDVVHVDGDFDAAFMQLERPDDPQMKKWDLEAEGRLFYVAMTRAKSAVELPPGAMSYFGIQNSHTERFGKPYIAERPAIAMRAAAQTNRTFPSPSARPAPVMPPSRPAPSQPRQPQPPGFLERILRSIFK
ncbi:MAG: UvrD-helicase domain-containing protein [Acidobacteriia bacterium]|nr:UvrD-helicase domain-containing protein [Terriglobia bacterium]